MKPLCPQVAFGHSILSLQERNPQVETGTQEVGGTYPETHQESLARQLGLHLSPSL